MLNSYLLSLNYYIGLIKSFLSKKYYLQLCSRVRMGGFILILMGSNCELLKSREGDADSSAYGQPIIFINN